MEFSKNKSKKNGFQSQCKSCERSRKQRPEALVKSKEADRARNQRPEVRSRKNKLRNIRYQQPKVKEKHKEVQRIRSQRPEAKSRRNELARINYQKPEVKAKEKERRQRPEVKARKKEIQKNHNKKTEVRVKINKNVRERRKTDIQFRLSHDARARRWEVLKRCNSPKHCGFEESLGCTLQEWEAHLQSNMPIHSITKIQATWGDFLSSPTKLHIDEIIPCDAWDLTDPVQYKLCFHYSNSQLLWAFDNQKKGGYDRDPEKYDKLVAEKLAEYYTRYDTAV